MSSQDRDGEGWILLEKTWRRPGDTGEDMELNKDTYILLSWGEDTECLLNNITTSYNRDHTVTRVTDF